ncbi:hypothetical protein J6590_079777 [Homalodisca vitripennis]|nr:hypothetical protein J6590_079777 [Homalodisca vitripennis]
MRDDANPRHWEYRHTPSRKSCSHSTGRINSVRLFRPNLRNYGVLTLVLSPPVPYHITRHRLPPVRYVILSHLHIAEFVWKRFLPLFKSNISNEMNAQCLHCSGVTKGDDNEVSMRDNEERLEVLGSPRTLAHTATYHLCPDIKQWWY